MEQKWLIWFIPRKSARAVLAPATMKNLLKELIVEKEIGFIYLKGEIAKILNVPIDGNFQLLWKAFQDMHFLSKFDDDYEAQVNFLVESIKYL